MTPPDAAPEQWRLFIAIELPDAVKDRVEGARNALRETCKGAAARWTRREQFHLTLRFLGNVEAARAGELESALRSACARFSPLELTARGVGFFPQARRPRVLWVGIEGGEPLRILQRAVQEASAPFTGEPSEHEFTGHVTLARIREIRGGEAKSLASAAEHLGGREFGAWTAGEIHLIRSQLSSGGALYSSAARIVLAP